MSRPPSSLIRGGELPWRPACHVVVLDGDGRPAVAGRTRLSENPHSADVTLSCRAVASAKAENDSTLPRAARHRHQLLSSLVLSLSTINSQLSTFAESHLARV